MLKFIFLFGTIIILIIAGLSLLQVKILFHPTFLEKNYIFKFDVPFEEKFIAYGKQENIHGLLFKPIQPIARILYFHGNGGALDSWGYAAAELAQKLNCEVLILDYPGYGKSSGGLPTSEKALYESAEAALQELTASNKDSLPIILYGRSLGSAVASYLAAHSSAKLLILETPYLSIKAMAAVIVPFAPSFLVRYDLDNQKNIKNLNIPTLILHGTADTVIPFSQAKQLSEESPAAKFVTVEGGDHNNLSDFPQYWEAVTNFVRF